MGCTSYPDGWLNGDPKGSLHQSARIAFLPSPFLPFLLSFSAAPLETWKRKSLERIRIPQGKGNPQQHGAPLSSVLLSGPGIAGLLHPFALSEQCIATRAGACGSSQGGFLRTLQAEHARNLSLHKDVQSTEASQVLTWFRNT